MLMRMVGSEGGRLRDNHGAQEQQYEQRPRDAALRKHSIFIIAWPPKCSASDWPPKERGPREKPSPYPSRGEPLHARHVLGLQTLGSLLDLELHLRAFIQRAVAVRLD